MGVEEYRVCVFCGRCRLHLLQSPESITSPIVFCDYCLSGGPYKEVMEEGKSLTARFVTREQVNQMLREIGDESAE